MVVSEAGGHAATGRALDEAFHDEERLVDFLDGTGVLADGGGNGAETDRTATELIDDGSEYLVVDFVEPVLVDVQGTAIAGCGGFRIEGNSYSLRIVV